MTEKDFIEKLQEKIEIPDIVQEKTNLAFQHIKSERTYKAMRHKKRTWKLTSILVAAAVLAFGTTVCAAVYMHWSKGLETRLQATNEKKLILETNQLTAPLSDSVTENGVTVTALQTIVDSRFAYLAFQVDGYQVEEGVQPDFDYMTIQIGDGEDYNLLGGSFFDGLQINSDGNFTYLDGSLAKETPDGSVIGKYTDENGSMEYLMLLMPANPEESFVGKPLHLEFHNLGTVDKAEFTPDIEAVWSFDLTLEGSDEIKNFDLSETLGDSGATVIHAEISPISLLVNYDMPYQTTAIDGVDENGQTIKSSTFAEAPKLTGVRLKDGTLLTGITNGGSEGYPSGKDKPYQAVFSTSMVIDPEQVDALLFVKSYPDGQQSLTEENLYIVPLQ